MKKIVWIFGESATGKKTFVENIISNSNPELLCELGLADKKIDIVKRTIDKNLSSFDDLSNEKSRHESILENIKSFVEDTSYDVLLLKGQSNDMDERYGNTLKEVALLYPEIEKDIFLLEVKDMNLLYNRIINKDWWKEDPLKYANMFPREWIDRAVIKHREQVYSYINLGYKITVIDSTNGYELLDVNKKER